MKIIVNSINNRFLETLSFENLDNNPEALNKYSKLNGPLETRIFAINESISSHRLLEFKNKLDEINKSSLCIYSNNRETIIAGKFLKINSKFVQEREIKNNFLLLDSKKRNDILYEGTVRSGDRISSNGNLCIIGDVNPGAIVSAKKNIYVWGKLLGIAFAGKSGNINASITSLFLNPLQLRIADVIAVGPKEKPKNHYPEIAVIEKQTINIKPYIVEVKN